MERYRAQAERIVVAADAYARACMDGGRSGGSAALRARFKEEVVRLADDCQGAVEALREIANGQWAGWSSGQPRHIAQEALEAMGVDPATDSGGR